MISLTKEEEKLDLNKKFVIDAKNNLAIMTLMIKSTIKFKIDYIALENTEKQHPVSVT